MPNDNIERAIKKGTGELPGVSYESIVYEGYAPANVAVLVEVLTDNKNRAAAEIRHLFTKHGGKLGSSVSWIFEKKGLIEIGASLIGEDELMEIVIDAGAEDIKGDDESWEVYTQIQDLEAVKKALEQKEIKYTSAEITMIPKNTVTVTDKDVEKVLKFLSALDDHEDVQNVYANFDIAEELMEQFSAG